VSPKKEENEAPSVAAQHDVQKAGYCLAPHFGQNLVPPGTSAPQFVQNSLAGAGAAIGCACEDLTTTVFAMLSPSLCFLSDREMRISPIK
jgi:lipid-binding SYLF domain-containing protein